MRFPSVDRCGNGQLSWPTASYPCPDGALVNADYAGPRSDRLSAVTDCDQNAVSFVTGLFGSSGPSAIVRCVVAVVVASVERVCGGWFRSQVSEKIGEAVKPTLADRDSAPTVIGIAGIGRSVATVLHRPPDVVLRRLATSMCPIGLTGSFSMKATARLRVPGTEIGRMDVTDVPAFTRAFPHCASIGLDAPKRNQSAKYLAGQINGLPHIEILADRCAC